MPSPTKITPTMQAFVRTYSGHLPGYAIAEFLSVARSTVRKCIDQLRIKPKRDKTLALYPWVLDTAHFSALSDAERSRLRDIRFRHLVEYCWRHYPTRYSDEDLCLAEVILLYRHFLPEIVIARLFKIDAQRVRQRASQLGIKIEKTRGSQLQVQLYRGKLCPALPRLSAAQQARVAEIYKEIRQEFAARAEAKSREIRSALLKRMKAAKRTYLRTHAPTELFKCRGTHCKTAWPRTSDCFHRDAKTADGLEGRCKYCNSVEVSLKPGRKNYVPQRKQMPAAEEARIVKALRAYSGVIPPMYLRKLFNITQNQILRLRKLAEVKLSEAESRKLLVEWRATEPKSCSEYTELTGEEQIALFRIWNADRGEYLRYMAEEDRLMLELMESERQQRLLAGQQAPLVTCLGVCQRSWPEEQYFFPKSTHRKLKQRCRVCQNKLRRKIG